MAEPPNSSTSADARAAPDSAYPSSPLARAKPIFLAVRALAGSEREAELARQCGDDTQLRRLVETLLAGERAPLPFETLADEIVAARGALTDPDHGDASGTRIGPYRVLEKIGEGGFGIVYLAEQEAPVRRRVALKVLKLGMDTRQVVARFEAERQALAVMDHPAIARVFDAGTTHTGRPYFVMELVGGEPITTYCDRRGLPISDRLRLFGLVCDGVQHAHQKGVIHRDLKPGNILVTEVDGRACPKIIDFGIAKALQDRLREHTLFTERGQLMGTPAYMSPEQALGDPDIDTRTDVFSLGVLLYELVAGQTPIALKTLRSTPAASVPRLLAEANPSPPSTLLRHGSASSRAVAAARGTDIPRLRAVLRRELDWITLKALERERQRRYGSAADLAADLRRYLAGEAVLAAPPSRWYALRKSVRRNRGAVIAASLIILTLALGLIGTISKTLEARRQAAELAAVTEFQSQLLARIDASEVGVELRDDLRDRLQGALGRSPATDLDRSARLHAFDQALDEINFTDAATDLVERVLLRPAIAEIDERFADAPGVSARLRRDVASVYHSLGRWSDALRHFELALRSMELAYGRDSEQALAVRIDIANILKIERRTAEAMAALDDLRPRVIRTVGADHGLAIRASTELANLYRLEGRFDEAIALQQETLERCRRALPAGHHLTLAVMNNLSKPLSDRGDLDQAEKLLREVLQHRVTTEGPDSNRALIAAQNLGQVLLQKHDLDGAETLLRRVVDGRSRLMGLGHPRTSYSAFLLAETLALRGKDDAAEALIREVWAALPPAPQHKVSALTRMSFFYQHSARFSEAESALLQARALAVPAELPVAPIDRLLEALYREWHVADPAAGADVKLAAMNGAGPDRANSTRSKPSSAEPPR